LITLLICFSLWFPLQRISEVAKKGKELFRQNVEKFDINHNKVALDLPKVWKTLLPTMNKDICNSQLLYKQFLVDNEKMKNLFQVSLYSLKDYICARSRCSHYDNRRVKRVFDEEYVNGDISGVDHHAKKFRSVNMDSNYFGEQLIHNNEVENRFSDAWPLPENADKLLDELAFSDDIKTMQCEILQEEGKDSPIEVANGSISYYQRLTLFGKFTISFTL